MLNANGGQMECYLTVFVENEPPVLAAKEQMYVTQREIDELFAPLRPMTHWTNCN